MVFDVLTLSAEFHIPLGGERFGLKISREKQYNKTFRREIPVLKEFQRELSHRV